MRRDNDFYETRRRQDTIELLNIINPKGRYQEEIILECCNGKGAISDVLKEKGCKVITNDKYYPADYRYDAAGSLIKQHLPDFHWVITNPPYAEAYDILMNFVGIYKVALLLNLNFIEPTIQREVFLHDHPPRLHVLPRFSYTENKKTYFITSAWMIWDGSNPNLSIARRY